MTTNLTLELQDQIKQEADEITARFKDNNDYQSGVIQGYGNGYVVAGEKYALKWQAAEQKAVRYEKALQLIEQMSDPGDHWKAICDMKAIASEALNP